MRRARAACALVAAGAALGGCSLGSDDEAERTRTVEVTTRVEVFADDDAEAARPFDPQRVYEREAPGVVTVFSVFGGGGVLDREPEQEGAGSGFVLDGDGEIATNAHVVTTGQGDELKRAKEVFVQFADGNQVEGFQIHLGGSIGGAFGKKVRGLKTTADELPDYVERVLRKYQKLRSDGESFADWVQRAEQEDLA